MSHEKLYFKDVSSVTELIDDVKPEFEYHTIKPTEHVGYEVYFTETIWFKGAKAGVMWVTIPLKDYGSEEEIAEEAWRALQDKKKELLEEGRQKKRKREQRREIERESRKKAGKLSSLLERQS